MADHNELGKSGEEYACNYLISQGLEVLTSNFVYNKLEIDLIAKDKMELVIVEVKTRSHDLIINPKDAITLKKQKHLFNAAEAYVNSRLLDLEIRFDIVEVLFFGEATKINWIKDAFRPGW